MTNYRTRIAYLADLEYSLKSSQLVYHSLSLDAPASSMLLDIFSLTVQIDPPQASQLPTLQISNASRGSLLPLELTNGSSSAFRRLTRDDSGIGNKINNINNNQGNQRNDEKENNYRFILELVREQVALPQGNNSFPYLIDNTNYY